MQNSRVVSYGSIEGVPIHLTLYLAETNRKNKTILYLHGGGFVYGTADDLPETYLKQLLEAGYDFVTLEYPLAPEVKLDVMIQKIIEGIDWFLLHYSDELSLNSNEYILFGRSAGAYLSVQVTQRMRQKPQALLLLYGFHTLQEASFRVPSRHYLTFPKVEDRLVKGITKGKPVVNGLKETRFAIYIHYRQAGNWIKEILNSEDKPSNYTLSNSELSQLPPAFLAASNGDPDVPYRISKKMAETIPGAFLETIVSDEHDFDRTTTDAIGKEVYTKIIDWLENL
ncbi:alpha/beta hydrolase [Jeotgalibaca ciconiae]|uniref:Alpha/beta hydrolase n=1 Tax=Jeotgalibaca ciconiae TaxID=2496265 RepID=A0A3S9H828_9LACT|nr:alpha/beta hydrolase [Jeotgalibaca ciconiae]AZP03486.1 alpha/beta hydrolase [Jeotgalibaca ciconiae]HJB23276.1 alpha/beta hydrolase [Candidatus Jeotgalibaca pullicola]